MILKRWLFECSTPHRSWKLWNYQGVGPFYCPQQPPKITKHETNNTKYHATQNRVCNPEQQYFKRELLATESREQKWVLIILLVHRFSSFELNFFKMVQRISQGKRESSFCDLKNYLLFPWGYLRAHTSKQSKRHR